MVLVTVRDARRGGRALRPRAALEAYARCGWNSPSSRRVRPRRRLLHDDRDRSADGDQTAFIHCRPGGVALIAPDHVRENFRPSTDHGGHDGGNRSLRYLEWTWDPDPDDSTYLVDYAYLLRSPDGTTRAEHDQHVEGLFSRASGCVSFQRSGSSRVLCRSITRSSSPDPTKCSWPGVRR